MDEQEYWCWVWRQCLGDRKCITEIWRDSERTRSRISFFLDYELSSPTLDQMIKDCKMSDIAQSKNT